MRVADAASITLAAIAREPFEVSTIPTKSRRESCQCWPPVKSLLAAFNLANGYRIMKMGIVGAGRVGSACALAAVVRGSARYIVTADRTPKRAKAVATDHRYGSPLCLKTTIVDGDYDDLADAALVMVTAGINEKAGGATDRNDPEGRLRLLDTNAEIYREIVPHVVGAAPGAVI